MTEDKPGTPLTVIEGGRGKKSGKAAGNLSGLTAKQELFAQGLANGLTNAEAYRAAYDAGEMKDSTIWSESCKQAQHPKVAARVHELLLIKKAGNSMSTVKASDRVWRNVWRLAEGENVPPSVQQAAIALAAKMAGMLTDKVEIDQTIKDSKSIEAELLQRLQKLTA